MQLSRTKIMHLKTFLLEQLTTIYLWWNFLTPALKHIMLQNGENSNIPNSCSVVSSNLSTKGLSSWYQLA
jgi:hypothetical protein